MYFLCRLIPPRPSLAKDAFGPVMDPKGRWGELQENDPAIRAGVSYEAYEVPRLVYAAADTLRP